ncbi:MAG TPA: STAS domain-containing protein [Solirubrobacteraceae bacterium]|nr:STAS domain-containing protein [Solirubrobacteraceae bacterium]
MDATLRISIRAPLTRDDLPGLYQRVCRLLDQAHARTIRCDIGDIPVDAVAIDALARLQLAARRRGAVLELLGASADLRDLLAFTGLDEAVTPRAAVEGRTAGTADR